MKTEPRTIASCRPSVLVFGAGLNGGDETVCGLYDKDNGHLVVNTTGKCKEIVFIHFINFSFYSCYPKLKTCKGIKTGYHHTNVMFSCAIRRRLIRQIFFLKHLSKGVPFYNDQSICL